MKLWVHRYELSPVDRRFKSRAGALVKAEWAHNQIGYSDLHPWPEFGEPDLDEHIESLRKIKFTPLAEHSLGFNYVDRELRLAKRNAFAGLIPPRSHRLVTDLRQLDGKKLGEFHKAGFTHLKVKMGYDLEMETAQLLTLAYSVPMLWRIDLNGKLSAADFATWWKDLGDDVRAKIDFVEDPTAGETLKILGPWADDWKKQERAQIRILKPARDGNGDDQAKYSRLIFTHSMDHPLGQACAAWTAARFYADHPKKNEVCGLAAPSLYAPNEFSQEWMCDGPRLKPTVGTGFGFDALLAGLTWDRIL